jgi:proline racemase
VGEDFVHEGILGSVFTGRILAETTVGTGADEVLAVVPEITGQAWVTQYSQVRK